MAGHINDSGRADWCTPAKILDPIRKFCGGQIHLDPCSNPKSAVGALVNYSLETRTNGLMENWEYPSIFVNPPYGTVYVNREFVAPLILTPKEYRALDERQKKAYVRSTIADWLQACATADYNTRDIFALIPAATDTRHWHKYVWGRARTVNFIKGRLRFEGAAAAAPFASALVYWGPRWEEFETEFAHLGHCAPASGS